MPKKTTIDLSEKSENYLEERKKQGFSYNSSVNTLIECFCSLTHSAKVELTAFCTGRINSIYNELDKLTLEESPLEFKALTDECQSLMIMTKLLSSDRLDKIDVFLDKKTPEMKKIKMKNAILRYPNDFILINAEAASSFRYAYCIDFGNIKRADFPRLIYFFQDRSLRDIDESLIYDQAGLAYPPFKEIRKKEVPFIPDPDNPYKPLNEEDYNNSPKIRIYLIPDYDSQYYKKDIAFVSNFNYPYGMMVIRENK